MMSAAVSTSRATSRTSKDKSKATAHQTQTKSDGPPSKVQPTEEQMRIAQITSGQDDADLAAISQLMEMTGKSEDTVAVALHDCENDLERAALMLLEEQDDEPQGEWKVEQSKKKKRTNNASVPIPKTEPVANHVSDKSDSKRDRSRDDDRPDNRHDGPPRRGRRNGGPPPRLARGRGRDRNNQYGERNAEGDNEGFRHRDGFGDRGGKGNYQDGDGYKDHDGYRDQDGFRDKENGFGGFGRERSGDRGRGRGRGNSRFAGRGGRGRGGGGGGGFKSEGRPQRFDKGPQIDTWTNETAENADKEPAGWGETWESAPASEDWNDDTWQGSLTESKVFTASTVKEEPMAPSPLNDITSSMGQSNSLGQSGPMPSSMGQPGPLRQPGSIVTSNSLGQPSTLGQRLDLGTLLKTAEQQQQQANDNLIAQYNQQATESIKNTIGIGSSSRSNLSNLQPQAAPSGLSSYSQNLQQGSSISAQSLAAQQMSSQPPHVQQALQQRPKPQRSKLPPPSKIPASAVEMPGHVMPQLDVQFGVDFGADSSSPFSFGSSDSAVTASSYTTTTQNRTWKPLALFLESERVETNNSTAKGILQRISSYKFLLVLHLLMDIIPIMTRLSLHFQKEDIDLATLRPSIDAVIQRLQYLKDENGPTLVKFESQCPKGSCEFDGVPIRCEAGVEKQFSNVKASFLQNLMSQLECRFPAVATDVVTSMSVLSLKGLSFLSEDARKQWGTEQLQNIIDFYSHCEKTFVDAEETLREWAMCKDMVHQQHYPCTNICQLWQILSSRHPDTFPNLFKIAQVAVLLPLQTATVERGFSVQNLIKRSHRNRLSSQRLDTLMQLALGPPVRDVSLTPAVTKWKNDKKRKLFC